MAAEKEIKIHGHRIFYKDSGAGQPVVLVHGWTGSSFDWRLVESALAETCRVLAPDQVGFGKSDKPQMDYTIENFVEYLDEFINLLNLGPVHLAGNSMGGHIACEYALSYPAKVRTLALIDSAGVRTRFNLLLRLARVPGLLEFMLSRVTQQNYRRYVKTRGPYYDPGIVTEEMIAGHMQSYSGRDAVRAAADSLRRNIGVVFVEDRLGELDLPALVLWGKQDKTLPVSMAYTFHRKIKNSRLVILEECGHLPMEEKPEECARAMIELISQND